jgi:carboxyl-terminal processing protease
MELPVWIRSRLSNWLNLRVRRVPGRLSIGGSFRRAETEAGPRWVAQDVHDGGPAHAAGLRPLDILTAINGKPINPPAAPMFPMGVEVAVGILRGSEQLTLSISIPAPRSRKQPYAEPEAVVSKQLTSDTGYLKVTILPGLLGLDVARSIDKAVGELSSFDNLVLDLRGHLGGGLGVLRLMSHLTPDKLPIGYTLTRKRAETGYDKNTLRKLDRLPTDLPNPLAIASMAVQFVGRDPSVLLVSEGLGPKRWHRRVVFDGLTQWTLSQLSQDRATGTSFPFWIWIISEDRVLELLFESVEFEFGGLVRRHQSMSLWHRWYRS